MSVRNLWPAGVAVLVLAMAAHAQSPVTGADELGLEPDSRIYVIRPGDTLWDISNQEYADAWKWPRIWENNPQVQNPHSIYPDEVLVMPYVDGAPPAFAPPAPEPQPATAPAPEPIDEAPETAEQAAAIVEPQAPPPMQQPDEAIAALQDSRDALEESRLTIHERRRLRPRGVYVRIGDEGVVIDDEDRAAVSILGGADERNMYGKGDDVYLSKGRDGDMRVGQRFYAYELGDDLHHPRTGESLGVFIRVVGVLEVREVHDEASVARITDSYDVIEPKHRLADFTGQSHEVIPVYANERVAGEIVRTQGEMKTIAAYQVFYSDLGTNAGVEVGQLVRVFRDLKPREDPITEKMVSLPPLQLGVGIVIDTSPKTSTVLIIRSTEDIHLGDRIATVIYEEG